MEVLGRIEPEIELLLPVPFPLGVHIGVEDIRVSAKVTKEFEINLVVIRPLR